MNPFIKSMYHVLHHVGRVGPLVEPTPFVLGVMVSTSVPVVDLKRRYKIGLNKRVRNPNPSTDDNIRCFYKTTLNSGWTRNGSWSSFFNQPIDQLQLPISLLADYADAAYNRLPKNPIPITIAIIEACLVKMLVSEIQAYYWNAILERVLILVFDAIEMEVVCIGVMPNTNRTISH